jgi:hypothetical protein
MAMEATDGAFPTGAPETALAGIRAAMEADARATADFCARCRDAWESQDIDAMVAARDGLARELAAAA